MTRLFVFVFCILAVGIGTSTASEGKATPHQKQRNVAIVIWNNAEVLDWAGPSEVFVAASHQAAIGSDQPFQVYTVSLTRDAIISQQFIDVIPDYAITNAPKPDIVVFPGGGTGSVLNDPVFLEWATRTAREAEIALSVCTGAFILGKAGLLDDKDVTTWYGATKGLASQFPSARVHEGRRFIDNGQVITTAGVSAGIDGALHVVARLLGRDVAERTAEYMEYLWAPASYLSQQYSWLNPAADDYGRLLQRAQAHLRADERDAAIALYRNALSGYPQERGTWAALGRVYYQNEDYVAAAEAYVEAAEEPRGRSRALYNAACSAALARDTDHALKYLQGAIDAGFRDARLLQHDSDLQALREDPRFAALEKALAEAETAAR